MFAVQEVIYGNQFKPGLDSFFVVDLKISNPYKKSIPIEKMK